MASSLGPVIDALLALAAAAVPTAQVSDGFPLTDLGGLFVGVGGSVEPTTEGQQTPNQIGGGQLREEYDVGVLINATSGDGGQKALRDAVIGAYDAIVDAWRVDRAARTGVWAVCDMCWPTALSLLQTNADTLTDARPWFAELTFSLHVINRN